jgi:hypothetical protein
MKTFSTRLALIISLAQHARICAGTRERISQYVQEGQQFLVLDPPNIDETILFYEDPNAEIVTPTYVY